MTSDDNDRRLSTIKPIKPSEVVSEKTKGFPDEVISSFNKMIAQNWNGRSSSFTQTMVFELMISKGLNRKEIIEKDWLRVEGTYRELGWIVEIDRPAYDENYETTYIFKKDKH
ncbi:MAG: hypothetical protein AAB505_02470 [Patescibacteria group bacterium]